MCIRDRYMGIGAVLNENQTLAVFAEVNCETDFVAKTDLFLQFVGNVLHNALEFGTNDSQLIRNLSAEDVEKFCNERSIVHEGKQATIGEARSLLISKMQENVQIKRLGFLNMQNRGLVGCYVHRTYVSNIGLSAALVGLEAENLEQKDKLKELASGLAMQVLAARPSYVSIQDISAEVLQKEKDILKESFGKAIEGKPQNVVDRMLEGKMKKYYEDSVLLEQQFVALGDDASKETVAQYLKRYEEELGTKLNVAKFLYMARGEE
eukprot:TRINITY_DN7961_c0_g3_i13.p1 TRINITY_DN7961_c0_g3~~TRINITY_DN7961_c0_g3_i13.p1  ORF type:complete len:285 (+),score=115.69 TRINITY_DN7961_c0_g3_i13:61-855(+)